MKTGRLSQPSDLDHLFSWMWVKFPNTCMEPVGSSPKNSNSKHIPIQKKRIPRPCLEYVSAILGSFFLEPGFWGSSPLQNLQVTIAHSKDGAIRPNLPTQGWLLGDLGSKKKSFGWRKWQFFASGWAASSMKVSLPGVICIHEMFGHFGGITPTLPPKIPKTNMEPEKDGFPKASHLTFPGSTCTILWRISIRSVRWRIHGLDLDVFDESIPNPLAVLGWNMGRYLRYPPWN